MLHQLTAEGFGLRFRPVTLNDAPFIIWVRNLQHAKGRINDTSCDVAFQRHWIEQYFERPLDYYFIIETSGGVPVGTFGFYNFDQENTAETGRWVMRLGVPAALPGLVLALGLAFEQMKLPAVRARTVSNNHAVLSIHRKVGFRQIGLEPSGQIINGAPVDMVLSTLSAADGLAARERLIPPARWAERRIREWEQSHATIHEWDVPATAPTGQPVPFNREIISPAA